MSKKKDDLFISILTWLGVYLLYNMLVKKADIPASHDEQLTKNFRLKEFHSHDGAAMPYWVYENVKKLANNLQYLRDIAGSPITINSGYRSPAHNANTEGAVENSRHTKGQAADISVKDLSPRQVNLLIEQAIENGKMAEGGLGLYNTFNHYDTRGNKARWRG
ncbi:MAG: hypothetical protein RLZZ577_1210 [Bacteroidota bacterium]|jgi:uncharacterized protein YcbK (DUF882 family)